MSVFSEMLQYDFLRRALLVGFLVSLCAALLGVSLVLKRYSMIGDGLSHVGFGTLAVATALGVAPLKLTIPVVVAAAFLTAKGNPAQGFVGQQPEFTTLRNTDAILTITYLVFGASIVAIVIGLIVNAIRSK